MRLKQLTIGLWLWWSLTQLSAQVPFTCQGQYFLSLSPTVTSNSGLYLVEIDPVSGNTVFNTITTSVGATVNAMGYRSTDNFIYGVNPQTLTLYRVGADGIAQNLGVPQGIITNGFAYYAGDVTPDGNYLVLLGQATANNISGYLAFVDLTDPDYQVTSLSLINPLSGIYDIAFDPYTGELYGFSTGDARLVKIDPATATITSGFPMQPQVNQLGAIFFDVSGNLFGYGAINGQPTLVSINKNTGIMTSVANGPPSGGEDGCSCPYTIELKKTVSTDIALPCTEVIYTFVIFNGSGILQTGLQLTDILPENFTVLEILSNPFGGIETISGHAFDINNMSVPPGIDSIHVLVEIGQNALGLYQNQAVLTGLPSSLGDFTYSDYPNTLITPDSTPIQINPLDITFIEEEYMICPGDFEVIDASLYGVTYLWEDGTDVPIRVLDTPGDYSVTVTSGCDQVVANIIVTTELVYSYLEEQYYLCEGIPILLDVNSFGNIIQWEDGAVSPQREIEAAGTYAVTVYDGCEVTVIDYEVLSEDFFVNILPEFIQIELGSFTPLNAIFSAEGAMVSFEWIDPLSNSLSCYDCLSPISSPFDDVEYTLIMSVENGCIYQDSVVVEVKKDRAIYIPNAISPNGDGVNEYFYVQSKRNNVVVNKMSIFDRWGNLVFKTENVPVNQERSGWDAKFKGEPVQSGVFVYLVELEFIDGFVLMKQGDVTVIR
ncbi:MAG: gliding motility-associated C-terminal domain-containing protein [Saprospiraceae bacterium]|nr:gliding motility-associated C-terminal domain-containing protein [Saprospiraceae bacterium]MCB9325204.1 gliding motility-associated C-terminal domain-containing protein [Lewinellaceae bacterium]